uniref:Large ribosomal subunit protein mL53 n=1 Tax=Craspedostauros australis TaxID=1486917 RepID=A0A7R9WVM4_9STRA|mmetsp:Transcript_20020/g.55707  ORF Transcript_20020/g.55707 Transcript_20020/m.55707 type:complete len:115 (+) Transcript_20020:165-509(+)
MPIKFGKDVSARLFRYVKQVDISFNPFDARTRSARELWRQMQATRFQKENPNLKVNAKVLNTPDEPTVVFTFVDDTQKRFESQHYDVKEIMFDVHLGLNSMDNEYEIAGKSLDD